MEFTKVRTQVLRLSGSGGLVNSVLVLWYSKSRLSAIMMDRWRDTGLGFVLEDLEPDIVATYLPLRSAELRSNLYRVWRLGVRSGFIELDGGTQKEESSIRWN
jgi:hypothetical protein